MMNPYRRGAVLGLTVAETFILLFFLLLFLLFGFIRPDDQPSKHEPEEPGGAPATWEIPDQIETLTNRVAMARNAQKAAIRARIAAEYERNEALEKLKEARIAKETAIQARKAAERERHRALEKLKEARIAKKTAIKARDISEHKRDQALEKLSIAEETAIQARKVAEKGKNPPCWYKIIPDKGGGTRERPHYVFNVAIFEDSIALEQRTAPPGGAVDDGGGSYSKEWERLDIGSLPYGKMLTDREFKDAVRDLVVQGKNQQVRTYKCVFSVMVWDKTPVHAKTRWKAAHDGVIEGLFNAYTVRDEKWRGIE